MVALGQVGKELSEETVEKLRRIMREDYGAEMTIQEAREAADNFVGFFELLAKIEARNKGVLRHHH